MRGSAESANNTTRIDGLVAPLSTESQIVLIDIHIATLSPCSHVLGPDKAVAADVNQDRAPKNDENIRNGKLIIKRYCTCKRCASFVTCVTVSHGEQQ